MNSPYDDKRLIAGSLSLALCLIAAQTAAQTDEEKLQALETKVNQLQQQLNKPTEERVRFNGFLSIGYGLASNDSLYADYDEEGTFNNETLFGLQGLFSITDSTNITMQLVGRGADNWEPKIEWAYISHQFSPNFTARAGKMRLPLFMYSDSLEVGYAQPWIRPPEEVYGEIPVTSYTGIDGIYDFNFDNSTLSLQVNVGESREDIALSGQEVTLVIDDLIGGSLTWTDFVWTLRSNFSTSTVSTGGNELDTAFYGIGGSYNNGSLQVISEFIRLDIDGPTPDTDAGYVTVAYTIGDFTPYATYSIRETKDNDERPYSREFIFAAISNPQSPLFGNTDAIALSDVNNAERSAYSLGVRWDVLSNVALKFDVTHAGNFGDTGGDLNGNLGPEILYDDVNLYSIKLDAAF